MAGIRKFDNSTKYLFPVDEDEIDRMELAHIVMRNLAHGNYNAPLEQDLQDGIHVLDVGCGSGRWILEMARDYPNSIFVGTDAAKVFPTTDIPTNASFMLANTLEGLPFADATFDYVHQRFMLFAFTPKDWNAVMDELVRVLKPAGWIELFELSMKIERPPANMNVWDAVIAVGQSRDIDVTYIWRLQELFASRNLCQIEADCISCPLGWSGHVGKLQASNIYLALLAMATTVAPFMDIEQEEYTVKVKTLILNFKECRSWHRIPYVCGRKPGAP